MSRFPVFISLTAGSLRFPSLLFWAPVSQWKVTKRCDSLFLWEGGRGCCGDSVTQVVSSEVKAALAHSSCSQSVTEVTISHEKLCHTSSERVWLLTVFKGFLNYKLFRSDATIWKLKCLSAYRKLHHEAYRHRLCNMWAAGMLNTVRCDTNTALYCMEKYYWKEAGGWSCQQRALMERSVPGSASGKASAVALFCINTRSGLERGRPWFDLRTR